jgi:hypothetical protein
MFMISCGLFLYCSRPHTVAYSAWTLEPTLQLDPALKNFAWRVPQEIVNLIPVRLHCLIGCTDGKPLVVIRNWNFIDVCAGKARIAKWCLLMGLHGCAIDFEYGSHMDINTDGGLAILIVSLLRICAGGLMFIAAQCSSWVWLSRATSERTISNPAGNPERAFVKLGNLLNDRCSLVCYIAHQIGVKWVIEQPTSSMFFVTPGMSAICKHVQAARVHLFMGDFGHPARKGTVLVGTAGWLANFKAAGGGAQPSASSSSTDQPQPTAKAKAKGKAKAKASLKASMKALVRRRMKNGKEQVFGQKHELKESQVYPARFALAVVKAHWPANCSK